MDLYELQASQGYIDLGGKTTTTNKAAIIITPPKVSVALQFCVEYTQQCKPLARAAATLSLVGLSESMARKVFICLFTLLFICAS